MDEVRPLFLCFLIVVVTIIFWLLYVSLPESIEAVDSRNRWGPESFGGEPKFLGKQVRQAPLLLGVWLVIVVPIAVVAIVGAVRRSRGA